jgi:hypothetical protein
MKKTLLFVLAMVMAISFGYSSSASAETVIEQFNPEYLTGVGAASDPIGRAEYSGSTVGVRGVLTASPVDKRAGGIVWSRHNLSAFGEHLQATISEPGNTPSTAPATTQICVFCHTPHHGRTDSAPLWNRNNAGGTYTAYGATLAGTPSGDGTEIVTGSSLACLTCHDGVTTIDNLINRPGKDTKGGDMGWSFTEKGTDALTGSQRTNIQTDLRNDHPMAIDYMTDGRASLRDTTDIIADLDMTQAKTITDSNVGDPFMGRSDNYWSVFGYINAGASIADLLRDGRVECASCHDPHYKNMTNSDPSVVCSYQFTEGEKDDCIAASVVAANANDITAGDYQFYVNMGDIDGLFLRRVGGNSNSGVCRTCHAK